jgi:hypothetical protein
MASDRERDKAERGPDGPDPKRTALAVILAWLVPGLGHVVLGRLRRGLIFGAIIWSAFALGLAHDGRLALRDARQPFLTTLQLVANLGVGPADLVARMVVYRGAVYTLPPDAALGGARRAREVFRQRARSGVSIYGTAYLWTAGLMNLLLLFDIWDIGRRKGEEP